MCSRMRAGPPIREVKNFALPYSLSNLPPGGPMSNRSGHFADLEMLYICRQVALDIFSPKTGS